MTSVFSAWCANQALASWFLACLIAQAIKIILGVARLRRFDFRWLLGTGGMPSTHAAGVSALSTTIGFNTGFNSPLFATAVAFTFITLFDAQGVRRWSGRQAQVLNKMIEDMYFKRRIQEERVKELLGHTPLQVIGGVVVGIIVALVLR
jgi:acid phosphatase family membrane protein YuiD